MTGSSRGVLATALEERLERVCWRLVADPDPRAGTWRHAELGGDPDHDVDLPVHDRHVGTLHRIAVRRLDHGALALDRGHRLDPERVRLAVSREQAAI